MLCVFTTIFKKMFLITWFVPNLQVKIGVTIFTQHTQACTEWSCLKVPCSSERGSQNQTFYFSHILCSFQQLSSKLNCGDFKGVSRLIKPWSLPPCRSEKLPALSSVLGTYHLCSEMTTSAILLNYLLNCRERVGIFLDRSFSGQSSCKSKHREQYSHEGQKSM